MPDDVNNPQPEQDGCEQPEWGAEGENPVSSGTQEPTVVDCEEDIGGRYRLPFLTVGIGASAGGVEALIDIFRNLSPATGMAFVIVTRLPADQTSRLPEIISGHTPMPAAPVENGLQPEPNHVYWLPWNNDLRMERGRFRLTVRSSDGFRHPIDGFFASLAADQRNHAVAVVLSRLDGDGAAGLKAVRAEGGIAIVQSPESARFPDMPRSSISAQDVDLILAPDQIALELAQIGRQFQSPEVRVLDDRSDQWIENPSFARILGLMRTVSGVDFRLYQPPTIRRRIARRMLMHRMDTLSAYAAFLRGNPKEIRELHEDALNNSTRFFRDSDVFEALKNSVLPQIFDGRSPDHQVRVWVAGCASGEEAYSIAICLLEYLTGSSLEPPIQISGTDASEQNIQKARIGVYPDTIAADVSDSRLRRFFVKTDKGYQVAKRVRDLCVFARQNLCHDPPFSRLDLISCRNVLMYFGAELQRQLIPTFHHALRPEGHLLLGTSETIREFTDLFALRDRKHKIYSRTDTATSRPFVEMTPRLLMPDIQQAQLTDEGDTWSDMDLQRAVDRLVLARYGPAGVVVNQRMEVLQSRGQTSPWLEIPQGKATLELPTMVRESVAEQVIGAVKRAVQEDLPVQVEGIRAPETGVGDTTLEVLPIHANGSLAKCYLVLFVPARRTETDVPPREPADIPEAGENEKDLQLVQMRRDLTSIKLYLESLFQERDAKNQELVSANEAIQSANDELQSTNEELETTKGELQSSNEELRTVNDELQKRNAVLTQASNNLSNLLDSVNLPVLMLSNDLSIRHFTPPAQKLMNLRAADIGRPFDEIRLNLEIDDLAPLFAEVLETLGQREIEVKSREGHWYLLRIRPCRTTDNKIDGLVVVLVDIDRLRRSQQQLRGARDFAQSVIESIPLPLVVTDPDDRIRSTNEAFCALAGLSKEQVEQRLLLDLTAVLWSLDQPLRARLEDSHTSSMSFTFEHAMGGEPRRVLCVRGRALRPGGERFHLVTFEDVTAHKEVERRLKLEGARLANEVESATKALGQSQEELRALTASLMTAQEDERRRVARELHDHIGQRLAVIALDSKQLEEQLGGDGGRIPERLSRVNSCLDAISKDIREMSHRLHPSVLNDLGLVAALRALIDDFREREGMITTFSTQDAPDELPPEVAISLYRICQEALRNVANHAGKTHVKVNLASARDGLRLDIVDFGVGFDMKDQRSGLGLISMAERARLIGAHLTIDCALGQGTQVRVFLPAAGGTAG